MIRSGTVALLLGAVTVAAGASPVRVQAADQQTGSRMKVEHVCTGLNGQRPKVYVLKDTQGGKQYLAIAGVTGLLEVQSVENGSASIKIISVPGATGDAFLLEIQNKKTLAPGRNDRGDSAAVVYKMGSFGFVDGDSTDVNCDVKSAVGLEVRDV